jgi:hypothetical protein
VDHEKQSQETVLAIQSSQPHIFEKLLPTFAAEKEEHSERIFLQISIRPESFVPAEQRN